MKLQSSVLAFAALALVALLPAASGEGRSEYGSAAVNNLIRAQWKQENITPSAPVDNARFLRRIYLDIIGTLPPPQVVADFIADKSADKREQAVEALLGDPRYADHWTEYWDSVLMGKVAFSPLVDRQEFRDWLHQEFANNATWNRFVSDLVSATGQNSVGRSYAEATGLGMMKPMDAQAPALPSMPVDRSKINGAVNWELKYAMTPADLAGDASKIFLGVQIQCAQCHDHKTEKWKQTDFRSFTACFTQAAPLPVGGPQMQANPGNVRQLFLRDVNFPYKGNKINGGPDRDIFVQSPPVTLDGAPLGGPPINRRRELAAWMTADDNPWFAQAIVNRMWSHFMGRGFVEPIDDFRPSNPAVIPDALKTLANDFKTHSYDLKYLIKTICATEAYQISAGPPSAQDPENRYFDRFRLKPMETDVLLNSLVAATNFQTVLARLPAGGTLEQVKARIQRQLTFVFSTDEQESEQKEFEGTIPQALLMLNGSLTNNGSLPIPGTTLAEVMAMPGDDSEKIAALYLRTVSRPPTPAEVAKWTAFVNTPREITPTVPLKLQPPPVAAGRPGQNGGQGQKGMRGQGGGGPDAPARAGARFGGQRETPKQQAYEDMFWALLNSSEFAFNH